MSGVALRGRCFISSGIPCHAMCSTEWHTLPCNVFYQVAYPTMQCVLPSGIPYHAMCYTKWHTMSCNVFYRVAYPATSSGCQAQQPSKLNCSRRFRVRAQSSPPWGSSASSRSATGSWRLLSRREKCNIQLENVENVRGLDRMWEEGGKQGVEGGDWLGGNCSAPDVEDHTFTDDRPDRRFECGYQVICTINCLLWIPWEIGS